MGSLAEDGLCPYLSEMFDRIYIFYMIIPVHAVPILSICVIECVTSRYINKTFPEPNFVYESPPTNVVSLRNIAIQVYLTICHLCSDLVYASTATSSWKDGVVVILDRFHGTTR